MLKIVGKPSGSRDSVPIPAGEAHSAPQTRCLVGRLLSCGIVMNIMFCINMSLITEVHLWLVITHRYDGYSLGNINAGSGRIWLDEVSCRGTEADIVTCSHYDWGIHDCYHSEDVSVRCGPTTGIIKTRCSSKHCTASPKPRCHL